MKDWDLLSYEVEEDGTAFRMRLLTDCAKEIQELRHRLKSSAKKYISFCVANNVTLRDKQRHFMA